MGTIRYTREQIETIFADLDKRAEREWSYGALTPNETIETIRLMGQGVAAATIAIAENKVEVTVWVYDLLNERLTQI